MISMNIRTPLHFDDYQLIDSGDFEKLECFGSIVTRRPEPQAVWKKALSEQEWEKQAHAYFKKDRTNPEKGEWLLRKGLPLNWNIAYKFDSMHIKFRLGFSSFKHVGIFPEQADNWDFIYTQTKKIPQAKVLNLFAYTGGASMAAAAAGAQVTHVESIKQTVSWANDNVALSDLEGVRWMVEDALKFVQREVRRGNTYHGIILDPPAYGRGPNGEKWILEDKIYELSELCGKLLEPKNSFVVFNLYSMGLSALVLENLVKETFPTQGTYDLGELYLLDNATRKLPLGTYLRGEW